MPVAGAKTKTAKTFFQLRCASLFRAGERGAGRIPRVNSSYVCFCVSGTVAIPTSSAGGSPQIACGGTLRLTTVPARITAPSPILTFGKITQCGPMKTFFSMTTLPLLVGLRRPQ